MVPYVFIYTKPITKNYQYNEKKLYMFYLNE